MPLPKCFSNGLLALGISKQPSSHMSLKQITMSRSFIIIVGKFSLLHTLHQIILSRLPKKSPLFLVIDFFAIALQILIVVFFCISWIFGYDFHFIVTKMAHSTSGFLQVSTAHSLTCIYNKVYMKSSYHRMNMMDVPSFKKNQILNSNFISHISQHVIMHHMLRNKNLNVVCILGIPRHWLRTFFM